MKCETPAVLHRKVCNSLSHQCITRISTFSSVFGCLPDNTTLLVSLFYSLITPGQSITSVAQKMAPRLAVTLHYQDLSIRPLPPEGMVSALHVWTFDGQYIAYASNTTIKHLLAV